MSEIKKPINKLKHCKDLTKEIEELLLKKEYFDEEFLNTNKYKDVDELNKTFVDVIAKTNNEKSNKILVALENKDSLFANMNSVKLRQAIIGNIIPYLAKQLKEQNYTVSREDELQQDNKIKKPELKFEFVNQFEFEEFKKKEIEKQEKLKFDATIIAMNQQLQAENILKELELTNLVNYKIIDNNQKPLIEECNAKIEDIQELFVSSPETVFYFIDKPVMKTLVEYSQSYNFKNFFLHNPSLVLENLDKEAVKDFYQKNPNEINQVLTKAIESTITNEQQFDNLKSLQTFLTEFNIIGNQEQKNELANKINSQSALTNLININASFPGQTLGKGL